MTHDLLVALACAREALFDAERTGLLPDHVRRHCALARELVEDEVAPLTTPAQRAALVDEGFGERQLG